MLSLARTTNSLPSTKVCDGELSANATAIEAGFRTRKIQVEPTIEGFRRAIEKHLPGWTLGEDKHRGMLNAPPPEDRANDRPIQDPILDSLADWIIEASGGDGEWINDSLARHRRAAVNVSAITGSSSSRANGLRSTGRSRQHLSIVFSS